MNYIPFSEKPEKRRKFCLELTHEKYSQPIIFSHLHTLNWRRCLLLTLGAQLLGSEDGKEAFLGFLNAVLKHPPGKELTGIEFLDGELDPAYLLDRGAWLDVLARTVYGTLLNVEV